MSEILFIRHAETDMAGTFCGHSDPELNERGYAQIVDLIDRLRGEDIAKIYASDLRRAFITAQALADSFAVEVKVCPFLREINFGRWEGRKWENIQRQDESYTGRWIANYPHLSAPGGEDFAAFKQRVLEGMRLLLREAQIGDRKIAVVTHGGVLRLVMTELHLCSEEDAWKQTRSYCSIVRCPVADLLSLLGTEATL
jgi:alpha-ribazole phosphatase